MENEFEKQWGKALADFSIPPPENAWANIEKELEKEKSRKPLFFWWKNPYLISGIAALMVLAIGLYNFDLNTGKNIKSANDIAQSKKDNADNVNTNKSLEVSESTQLPEIQNGRMAKDVKKDVTSLGTNNRHDLIAENINNSESKILASQRIASKAMNPIETSSKLVDNENIIVINNEKPITQKTTFSDMLVMSDQPSRNNDIAYLEAHKMQIYANRFGNKRNKLPVPEFDQEVVASNEKSKSGGIKIGLNSGLAPFNPNFSQSGFTSQALASAKKDGAYSDGFEVNTAGLPSSSEERNMFATNSLNQIPTQSFSAGRSINLGFNISKNLKKNFSIESGIRFLQANSKLTSNVYSVNGSTGDINSYFASNLMDNASQNQTVLSFTETNNQTYNYLSIPVSLMYELHLNPSISLDAGVGISNDLLMNTTFIGQAANKQSLNAKNSGFNFINFSGLGTLRLNYNLNNKWQMGLGTSLQQSLRSGVSGQNNITFKPQMLGINYGLTRRIR